MDVLTRTNKGGHIRTADLLRSAAKLLRESDTGVYAPHRRKRLAGKFEMLATALEAAEACGAPQPTRMTDDKLRELIEQGTEW